MDLENKNILVTGGHGFLGSYVVEELKNQGASGDKIFITGHRQFDLRDYLNCAVATKGKDIVIHLAGNVGGIGYNQEHPFTLWSDNLRMGEAILRASIANQVKKLVIIGTVCEYPKFTPVPFHEASLWHGFPEETNAPYGIAKKSLLVGGNAARDEFGLSVIHLLPVNLYGPRDNFDPQSSHVIPALIKKVHEALSRNENEILLWGTGRASREFLYVEDAARGIVMATRFYDKPEPVNIGAGKEITIKELIGLICNQMNFEGEVVWDSTKPDGQPRRCLDVSRAEAEFGFRATTDFSEGLQKTIEWYLENKPDA